MLLEKYKNKILGKKKSFNEKMLDGVRSIRAFLIKKKDQLFIFLGLK